MLRLTITGTIGSATRLVLPIADALAAVERITADWPNATIVVEPAA